MMIFLLFTGMGETEIPDILDHEWNLNGIFIDRQNFEWLNNLMIKRELVSSNFIGCHIPIKNDGCLI